ncbi:MAG TPA: amidohydrolase, partial [Verrucomicrobiae bacterium]|nr:amidohydrolase [Verrucomicrobiae bacterium]
MDLNKQLVQWRRYLHQNPELSCQEYGTSDYLAKELATLGVEAHRVDPTGVVGIIQGQRGDVPTVALRADI